MGISTGIRRFGRILAVSTAGVLFLALLAGVSFALPNLEDLRSRVPRLDGKKILDRDSLSAADAFAYAEDVDSPAPVSGGGPKFAFSSPPPPGVTKAPAHWCARHVIGYRIDFTGAIRAGGTAARERYRWRRAFDEWTRASGGLYRFEYRGRAHYPITGADDGVPVDPAMIPDGEIALTYAVGSDRRVAGWRNRSFAPLADAIGIGGSVRVSWDGEGAAVIRRGMVVLDAFDVTRDPMDVPTPYIHELGHVMGLAHVNDQRQIMYSHAPERAKLAAGDEEGIARLAVAGC